MKIAVPYENGQVFQHLEKTKRFKLYEVESNQVTTTTVIDAGRIGLGPMVTILQGQGVDTLLCGCVGGCTSTVLAEANIQFCPGVSGEADAQVAAFLAGKPWVVPDYI